MQQGRQYQKFLYHAQNKGETGKAQNKGEIDKAQKGIQQETIGGMKKDVAIGRTLFLNKQYKKSQLKFESRNTDTRKEEVD